MAIERWAEADNLSALPRWSGVWLNSGLKSFSLQLSTNWMGFHPADIPRGQRSNERPIFGSKCFCGKGLTTTGRVLVENRGGSVRAYLHLPPNRTIQRR